MAALDPAMLDLEMANQRRHAAERRASGSWADPEYRKYSDRISARLDHEGGRFVSATLSLDDTIRIVMDLLKE
jgi:hypothetical protein